jgi:feruloyl-CoA synthase
VRVGPLRARMLAELGDLVHDVAIAGPDRDYVTALIFPNIDTCRSICAAGTRERPAVDVLRDEAVRSRVRGTLGRLACESAGLSTSVVRAMLMDQPPSIDAHETTEKGSINQKAVLANRAALVDELYAERPTAAVIEVAGIQ